MPRKRRKIWKKRKKMSEVNRIGKSRREGNRCDGRKDGIDVRKGRME